MAPHSSTLAWKIPWTEEPGRLQSMGSRRVDHDWATSLSLFTFMHWRRKWQPTPVFLPRESQGQGSLVGCRLWGHRVGHDWRDLAAAAGCFVQWGSPLHRTFDSSQIFPIAFFSLGFAPVKSCSSFIAQMKGNFLFFFFSQTRPPSSSSHVMARGFYVSVALITHTKWWLCSLDVLNIYQLACPSRHPLLYCDSLNTKLWSDVKDKGVLWQKWTHIEVKVRWTPHSSPMHNRAPALKWCSEMEVLQTRSSFLRRMVGLSYWQLRSAEIPLVVQWLGIHAFTAKGTGSIPGQETRIL